MTNIDELMTGDRSKIQDLPRHELTGLIHILLDERQTLLDLAKVRAAAVAPAGLPTQSKREKRLADEYFNEGENHVADAYAELHDSFAFAETPPEREPTDDGL